MRPYRRPAMCRARAWAGREEAEEGARLGHCEATLPWGLHLPAAPTAPSLQATELPTEPDTRQAPGGSG